MMQLANRQRVQKVASTSRPTVTRTTSRPVFRVRASDEQQSESAPTPAETPVLATETGPRSVQDFQILNPTTEAINGRSAMLGFVAAIASEVVTHHGVFSQLTGLYVNQELVEKPIGAASLGFAAIIVLTTMATLAPKLLAGTDVNGKEFGPFKPDLELIVGRVAQLGFLGLVLVEAVKGSSLL